MIDFEEKPADLRTAAYARRFMRIRQRALAAADNVRTLERWFDAIPDSVADTAAGQAFQRTLAPAVVAFANLAQTPAGSFEKEWAESAFMATSAAVAAGSQVTMAHSPVAAHMNTKFNQLATAGTGLLDWRPASNLSMAINAFHSDLFWLTRLRLELDEGATTAKFRTQRLRARRKAGFQMVTIAVHRNELVELRRLGLLRSEKGQPDSPDDIADAVQSFLAAGFAATSYADEQAERADPGLPTVLDEKVNDGLALWPVTAWMRRLAALAASVVFPDAGRPAMHSADRADNAENLK